MTAFDSSAHSKVPTSPTGAGIACDTCHESHSSRNEALLRYSGAMLCLECHSSAQPDAATPDIWSTLTSNADANAKHPLLPADQTDGARMTCQNCHNTHSSTRTYPLIDPHDPSMTGTWTASLSTNEREFCFTCHDGKRLPTSAETTPRASAVLASGGATTVADIKDDYDVNVHGLGTPSSGTTVTAYLRSDMGYRYGDVLQCRSCHDSHGSVNNFALQQTVISADGDTTMTGVAVAKVPSGGYDLRYFCGTCHLFDPSTHDSMAETSTVTFPTDCTSCHRHDVGGVPSPGL
jgi:predicted CXXCH cytochrome family protein